MENSLVNSSNPAAAFPTKLWAAALPILMAYLALPLLPAPGQAAELAVALERDHAREHASGVEAVAAWMRNRFSESEIDALSAQDFGMETHFCSCADQPVPHFPYRIVLFRTPKGDLVARAEAHEQSPQITPLAVRNGDEYCKLESEDQCYGSFANVCEFTDFRYGPVLKPFFPTCK